MNSVVADFRCKQAAAYTADQRVGRCIEERKSGSASKLERSAVDSHTRMVGAPDPLAHYTGSSERRMSESIEPQKKDPVHAAVVPNTLSLSREIERHPTVYEVQHLDPLKPEDIDFKMKVSREPQSN